MIASRCYLWEFQILMHNVSIEKPKKLLINIIMIFLKCCRMTAHYKKKQWNNNLATWSSLAMAVLLVYIVVQIIFFSLRFWRQGWFLSPLATNIQCLKIKFNNNKKIGSKTCTMVGEPIKIFNSNLHHIHWSSCKKKLHTIKK